jgi:hypothetical protein
MVEPWGGLGEERGSLPPRAIDMVEPWGGLGEERGSLPPSMH